jgi:hypothetical protein
VNIVFYIFPRAQLARPMATGELARDMCEFSNAVRKESYALEALFRSFSLALHIPKITERSHVLRQ